MSRKTANPLGLPEASIENQLAAGIEGGVSEPPGPNGPRKRRMVSPKFASDFSKKAAEAAANPPEFASPTVEEDPSGIQGKYKRLCQLRIQGASIKQICAQEGYRSEGHVSDILNTPAAKNYMAILERKIEEEFIQRESSMRALAQTGLQQLHEQLASGEVSDAKTILEITEAMLDRTGAPRVRSTVAKTSETKVSFDVSEAMRVANSAAGLTAPVINGGGTDGKQELL